MGLKSDSLNDDSVRLEAADLLRGMIDRIVLTPDAGELRIKLYGDLAEILEFATQDPETNRPGLEKPSRLSVVAGLGFEPRTFRL